LQTESAHGAFSLLTKPVREAAEERGFMNPTEPQEAAIPEVLQGKNILLIAPTASGKTEAVVLPIFSQFVTSRTDLPGIKILYLTPLRALNRDLMDRLEWWGRKLDVKVGVRHGDTETKERGLQAKSPPDMLITTPETLQAILPGKVMKRHLREVRWVIVDEVHELAEDKRGSQLCLALERLRWVTMREFQTIGLSATIGTPERVARFLVGRDRQCAIVRVQAARRMRLQVIYPEPTRKDSELASRLFTHPEVAARLRIMKGIIEGHDSVLLFTNTRAVAETLASRFKIWDVDFPVSIHHGSLAKLSRIAAEKGLKNGALKGLVATSSLELGIDIGRIDFVIQYMSPRQVTRIIQRLGRSGHSVGKLADGIIVALDSDDTLEALVIARRTMEEDLEPVSIPHKPLDVLTHQIAGLLTQKGRWYFYEIMELFTKADPYSDLVEEDLVSVLNYMHSRFPRLAWISMQDKIVLRPRRLKDLYEYYFGKLSMIPDEKQYLVVDSTDQNPVGVLDEAFVAEYGQPGTKFIVRGSPWRMKSIRAEKIYVEPIKDPTGAIPSWVGEEIPVPFEIAQEVGKIRRYVQESREAGRTSSDIVSELTAKYPGDKETLQRALSETFDQLENGRAVPTDKTITIEDWNEYTIVSAHFGLLVNRTLARLVGHLLSEELETSIGIQQDPYRFVLQSPGIALGEHVVSTLRKLPSMQVEDLLLEASKKTGLFKRRMVHVARRFGAISRWTNFAALSLRQLMKSFEGTVILDEAFKETLEKDLDLPHTKSLLEAIRSGDITLVIEKRQPDPSPVARIGLERISRKSDLIPAEKMRAILLESTRVRLLNEVRTFACVSCWEYTEVIRIKDLHKEPKCPNCGSKSLGMFVDSPEVVRKLAGKRRLTEREDVTLQRAKDTAKLVARHGRIAAVALVGRKISPRDALKILRKSRTVSSNFLEMVMSAEKAALKRRFL
jgi:ATP-dependent Lhr-like helicase